jgi:hypothetical protein
MTQLQIVNLALHHLGMKSITQAQLTANAIPSSVEANIFWEPCRDEVLGETNWSFSTSTLCLSALDIDDLEWEYVYSYPTLSVGAVWAVYDESTVDNKYDNNFEVKYTPSQTAKCIYSDLDHAYAEYSYKVTDPAIWSDKFNMAFSYRLAAEMAIPLQADAKKAADMLILYNGIVGEAKRIGASEKIKQPNQTSRYQTSR